MYKESSGRHTLADAEIASGQEVGLRKNEGKLPLLTFYFCIVWIWYKKNDTMHCILFIKDGLGDVLHLKNVSILELNFFHSKEIVI